MEKLICTIESTIYNNPDNGYSVFSVSTEHGNETITGNFQGVAAGTTLEAEGDWVSTKYGKQFAVEMWTEKMPATIEGIRSYLASGMINGIGPVMAKRIVKHFGAETLNIIEHSPERLSEVSGIGKGRIEKITASWEANKSIRDIMVFLQGYGVSPAFAVRIYKEYGKDSIKKVKENPYALADDVFGIGFKKADQIAFNMGYEKTNLCRIKAGVVFTLNQLATEGHCYADREKLYKTAAELLDVDMEYITEALNHLTFTQAVINEEDRYSLPMYHYSEIGAAWHIKRLLQHRVKPIDVDIQKISEKTHIEYDELQAEGIRVALRSKVMVLTGGPGVGKSTVINGIIEALGDMSILCAAPTGRAAKRMSEITGREAMTIHRLLEFNPKGGFGRNEVFPLKGDVLIVDECSMIDILLMNSLMKALPDKMRLILVGDIDQLPSVGAGNVLRDIIDSGAVPVVRLTKIFRQALTSRIITSAHRINHGEMPDLSNGQDTDFFFISQDNPEQAAKDIVNIVKERIPKAYSHSTNDIQVLAPMKNGAVGTVNLNVQLQEALNPVGEYIQSGQFKYRVGDRVMQIKNNYDKGVFNGDIGFVTEVDKEENTIKVAFDDNIVDYERGNMNELTLSYACTIHKSQGSEYPVVVMPIMMSHFIMLQRNLVYTGITRAKKLCILIGEKRALAYAVRNLVVTKRNTRLKERLNEE